MWLEKTAASKKSFEVGDSVKEKSTGREGVIVNHYGGRYFIDFPVDAGNPFKKDSTSFTEEIFAATFSKAKALSKTAVEVVDIEEDLNSILGSWFAASPHGVPETEEDTKMANEELRTLFRIAADTIQDEAEKALGPSWSAVSTELFPTSNETDAAKRKDLITKNRDKVVTLSQALYHELMRMFTFSKDPKAGANKIQNKIKEYLKVEGPIPEDVVEKEGLETGSPYPITGEYDMPNLYGLYEYFKNLEMNLGDMPLAVFGEKLREYGGRLKMKPVQKHVGEELKEAYEPTEHQRYPTLKKTLNENLKELNLQPVSELHTIPMSSRRAIYDVSVGDTIHDTTYGSGKVYDVTNIDSGFIGVNFGENVRIANYSADRICTPYYVSNDEFQCPLDLSMLTAEACLGDIPEQSCSFLKYINDAPTCTYQLEMKAMYDKRENEKQAVIDTSVNAELDKNRRRSESKKKLDRILQYSKFNEKVTDETHTPIVVTGSVLKKCAGIYGEVLERNADNSLLVKWADGSESVAWEVELTGISADAYLNKQADEKLEQALSTPVSEQSHDVPYTATNNPKDPASADMSIDVIIKDWSWVKEKDGQYVVLDKDNLIITKPDGIALTEAEWQTFIVPNRKNISALLTPPPEANYEAPSRTPEQIK